MRVEDTTVRLRVRSGWEAAELGMALVRRDAAAIWKAWALVTLPLLALSCLLMWPLDMLWAGCLVMLWLKPAFDRIPLYVISRSVFGVVPPLRDTLLAQLRWGWRPLLHYLTWRRLSPARSLLMPIELLEGGSRAQVKERRRMLGGAAYGSAILLTVVFLAFQVALLLACVFLIAIFMPLDYLPEAARSAWALLSTSRPWWAQLAFNLFVWIAVSAVEPFFVGAGFGLYLNRRTQVEAWDVELAFRRLRNRLLATSAPLLLACCALLAADLHAQERPLRNIPPQAPQEQAQPAPAAPNLPTIFGQPMADDRRFREAADRAYQDPLLDARRTVVTWQKRGQAAADPEQPDLSWLAGLAGGLALVAEWGLWILLGMLVVLLLVTSRHWLPWMRGFSRRRKPLPAEVEREALALPEALPHDVPAAARRLWSQGRPREALALVYRAAVATMSARANLQLPPGATESQCLRASARMPEAADRELFARVVATWQHAAYAARLPAAADFDSLLQALGQRFGWAR